MSLLTLVRGACRRIGIPSPTAVVASTDATTLLLLELAQEEGEALARYGDWRVLRKEKTFTTVAAETQTDTPLPTDLGGFIDGTAWNRNSRRRMIGPVSPEQWQAWKASSSVPVMDAFYLRGTSLLMKPTPAAGQTVAYEYRSSNWCQSSGAVAQSSWAADTDTGILSERLMDMGLIWRFKQSRVLEWQTDYEKYIFQVDAALATDSPRSVVDMRDGGTVVFGTSYPEGDWNL